MNQKLKYYRELLKNTFPMTRSDMIRVIKADVYNSQVRGALSWDEGFEILRILDIV